MNKWMLASITVLLSGGLALPVEAQDNDLRGGDTTDSDRYRVGDRAERGDHRGNRGENHNRGDSRRFDRGDESGDRRIVTGPRQGPHRQVAPPPGRAPVLQPNHRPVVAQAGVRPPVNQGHFDGRDGRRDGRYDRRDDRRDWRHDRRDDRRDWRHDRRDDRRDWRHDGRNDRRDWRHDRRDDRRDWRNDRGHDNRRYARGHDRRWNGYNWHPQYRYRAPVRYVYPRGYRAQQWRVGYRLPPSYYHNSYYVNYRNYYLPPPPYGYHWVRVDRDVVLVSIASGLIRDILHGLYY